VVLVAPVVLAQPKVVQAVRALRKAHLVVRSHLAVLVDLELPRVVQAVLAPLKVAPVVPVQPKADPRHWLSRPSFSAAMAKSTT